MGVVKEVAGCENCRFVAKREQKMVGGRKEWMCQRHAPRPVVDQTSGYITWPIVFPGMWCGEWEAN